jgi:hypothetical protein
MSRRSGGGVNFSLGWGGVEWGIERVEGSGDAGEVFDGAEVVGVAGEGGGICCEECNREERKYIAGEQKAEMFLG